MIKKKMTPEIISLESESLIVEIIPSFGGSISRFAEINADNSFNWLRPTPDDALQFFDPLKMACFPLVPYSNLIRNGCFKLGDRLIQLPLHIPNFSHTSHGDGWLQPWQIATATDSSLETYYRHEEPENPYIYTAIQKFTVRENLLGVEVSVRNESDQTLPFGLGLHPYFPYAEEAVLTTICKEVWEIDTDLLPTKRIRIPERWDLSSGLRLHGSNLNHNFGRWCRKAIIEWPKHERTLTMTASTEIEHLVLYAPEGKDFFCVEPVTHTVDAFNLAAVGEKNLGYRLLTPDMTMSAKVEFLTESRAM